MSLVMLAEFSDPISADLARAQLAAAGIGAVVFDGGMAGLGLGLMTPARLMVVAEDEAEARSVLTEAAQP